MQGGILSGVDKIIDKILKVTSIGKTSPHYRHKAACDQLHRVPLQNFAAELLTKVSDQIKDNWKGRPPSPKNWRFQRNKHVDKKNNKSLEIQLQRAIVNIDQKMWLDVTNWANHVPTASGLWDHKCDKHRAIDLVHVRPGQTTYDEIEFIELKVDSKSGHPVYAAMEILLYGLLYIFWRRHLKDLKYDVMEQPLLQAKTIRLVALAPFNYYDGCRFDWLEKAITTGLKGFITKAEGYTMDFQFQAFPWDCSFEKSIPDEPLIIIKALNGRREVEDIRRQYGEEAKRLGYEASSALAAPRSRAEKRKLRRE